MRRGTLILLLFVVIAAGVVALSQFLRAQPPLEIALAVNPLAEDWVRDAVTRFNTSETTVGVANQRVQINISVVEDLDVWAGTRRWTAAEEVAFKEIQLGAAEGTTPAEVATALEELDYVAEAWTHGELTSGAAADSFAELERRSLYPGRAREDVSRLGVEVRFDPYFLDRELGGGHGTPYWVWSAIARMCQRTMP